MTAALLHDVLVDCLLQLIRDQHASSILIIMHMLCGADSAVIVAWLHDVLDDISVMTVGEVLMGALPAVSLSLWLCFAGQIPL